MAELCQKPAIGPVETVEPVESVELIEPVEPVEPVQPVQPVEPVRCNSSVAGVMCLQCSWLVGGGGCETQRPHWPETLAE